MTHFNLWTRGAVRSGLRGRAPLRHRRPTGAIICAFAGALALLLAAGAASLAAPLHPPQPARSAQTPVREALPSYVGLNTIHITYTHESTCGAACRRELEVLLPDGSVKVLETIAEGATTGRYQHDKLSSGTYGYRIVETVLASGLPVDTTTTRYGTIDGLTIGGTLVYDEVVGETFACVVPGGVTVGDGLTLALDSARLISNCTITLQGSGALSAQGSDFVGDVLTLSGAGNADVIGSTFSAIDLDVGPDVVASITQSRFEGPLRLKGAAGSLRFQGNAFADVVRLLTRSAATFEDNLFLTGLSLDEETPESQSWCDEDNALSPTIRNNSFVGRVALGYTLSYTLTTCSDAGFKPVEVGPNYYGDPQGPVYGQVQDDPVVPGIDYGIRWLQRGAAVFPNPFLLEKHLESGTQWQDAEPFPTFWVNGYRLGQHTLTNQITDLMRNKESLFSVDLVTSHAQVGGARVWVMWNGQRVEPSVSVAQLVRDPGRKAVMLRNAVTTIDFFLPPTEGVTSTLELWLDTTGLTGFPDAATSGEIKKLVTLSIPLKGAPRMIGIHIVPVTVDGVTPSVGAIRSTLESATPAMLPVASKNLRISTTGYSPAWNTTYMPTAVLLNAVATDLVRYRGAMRYDPKEFPKGELMDFLVGVMPAGSLGGGDGVYLNLRRGIVLVDEGKSEAVFHELGHAIGLYNLVEQYNWPNYPPNGYPVEGVTLFLNQPTTSNATISGVFTGDSGRVVHTPAPGQWWHDPHLVVVDVMGNTAPFWPDPGTLKSFSDAFYSLAAEPRPTVLSPAAELDLRRVIVTVATERVEVTEASLFFGERRCAAYRPIIETARLFPRDAFEGVTGGSAGDPDVTHGALPLCVTADAYTYASGDIELCVVPIDENGIMPEYEQCQRVLAPEQVNTALQRDVAVLFYDVPTSAVRYSLLTRRSPVSPLLLTSSASLDVVLLAPPAGQTLTDTVTLRWDSQATPRDPGVPIGQPLLAQVSYSSDDGVTWSPVGMPVEEESVVLGTDFLPSGVPLAFRVTVSDGFLTDAAQVTGLHVPARPPEVVIHSPRDGDRAAPGYAWFLQAWSREDGGGTPAVGAWHSSLDGPLGSDPVLGAVVLSPGTHRLTYAVTDRLGASAQAEVTVSVGPMPTVDLAIAPDALALTMPWRDPVVVQAPRLRMGTSQTATLTLRNTGTVVTATLQLYIQPPGALERLVAQETLSLAPFETRWVGGAFTATVAGAHRFRGVVTAESHPDNDPGNNVREWEILAVSPAQLVAGAATVEFTAPAGTPITRSITLRNTGGLGLIVQRVALEQGAALTTGFRLWEDGCSGMALASTEACRVTVQYTPAEGIEEQVRLEIGSTDPDQPAQEVELIGTVGELAAVWEHVYLPLVVR